MPKPKMQNDENNLVATLPCSITAEMPKDGETAKNPRVTINGYNGGKMAVGYWGNVVVDLSGIKLPANGQMPIVYGHDLYDIDSILGQTDKIDNDGKSLNISGELMVVSELSQKVKGLSDKNFKFQASIGATPTKTRYVEENEQVECNGQTFDGPFYLILSADLREVSIVPLGADGSTSTQIAASHKAKEGVMPKPEDPTPQTPEQIRAEAVAETNRIKAVKAVSESHPEIQAKAISEGWTPERTENECLKASNAALSAKLSTQDRPAAPHISAQGKGVVADADILTAAACRAAGLQKLEATFGAETMNKATDLKVRSISELVNAALAAGGSSERVSCRDPHDVIKAAFSTVTIPNVISNAMGKFVLQSYATVEQTWRRIANVRPVNDFKAVKGVRLLMSGLLKDLNDKGELQHVSLSDETSSLAAKTKGSMITISRQDIINDDLGVLATIPSKFGLMSARTFNTDFWKKLNDASAQFTSDRKNTTVGALSLDTLKTADALFGALTDGEGNPLGLTNGLLLCSVANRVMALDLFKSTALVGGSTKGTAFNSLAGMYEPIVSAYLTAAPWYLTAGQIAALMEVAFLNGNDTPVVETAEADFSVLGMSARCYFDYGVEFGDHRGTVRSTGAAQ